MWRAVAAIASFVVLSGNTSAPIDAVPARKPLAAGLAPQSIVPKHRRPLSKETAVLLAHAGVTVRDPIYIRVFKEESELEIWKARADGTYALIKTYPICTFSGGLGPKTRYADYQSPEGFYAVTARLLNPNSAHHLAFNIGYPNALDRALGRTGDLIMVHGRCQSVGCFAMTDAPMEEVYAFVRDALAGGQTSIPVHSFPFRMTAENIARHASHRHAAGWAPLEQAYRDFAATARPPATAMCDRHYLVNPVWAAAAPASLDAAAACPAHARVETPDMFRDETATGETVEPARVVAEGPKRRTPENIASWGATRARVAIAAAVQRRVRREQVRVALAARDQADIATRSNLGMTTGN